MRALIRAACLFGCVAALAACDTVEFQSPPGELTACDEALVGDWRVEPLGEDADDVEGRQYLRVTAGCERWWTVAEERDGAEVDLEVDDLEEDMVLGFARSATQAFIAVRDRPKQDASEPAEKPDGYTLVAWSPGGDETYTLRRVDLRAVSHLIVDDRVPGWIEKRDRRPDGSRGTGNFWVYVFGSSEEIRTLLDTHPLLDEPWMRLHPASAAESAEIDAWLREAGSGKQGFEARDDAG